jgi:hypothetical protein
MEKEGLSLLGKPNSKPSLQRGEILKIWVQTNGVYVVKISSQIRRVVVH